MKKGDKLLGSRGAYVILKDFQVTGGMSKVSFARLEADGQEYFIKEFLSPKYPGNASLAGSPATIAKKKENCARFEEHHIRLNREIAKKSGIGGNLIAAFDFFRFKTTYYKVCEKVDISSISIGQVSRLSVEKKVLILRTIVSSLKILHDLSIVHGDLKQDNILIKQLSEGKYVSKLIDFDNSYFSGEAPDDPEKIIGTQEYYSPELARFIINKEPVAHKQLTVRSDVFALGILFCEYWNGEKPPVDPTCQYIWQQVIDGRDIAFPHSLPPVLKAMFGKMLSLDPEDRPDLSTIIADFRNMTVEDLRKTEEDVVKPTLKIKMRSPGAGEEKKPEPPAAGGGLKGKLLKKSEEKK